MATIEKRGKSYRITAYAGYNADGSQCRRRMTWTPQPGMTERQIQRELKKQAVLFEEGFQSGEIPVNRNIRLRDFLDIFMANYVRIYRKPNTVSRYERGIRRIKDGLGHMKVGDIRPVHVSAFSKKLQEDGVKDGGGKLAPSSVNTIMRTLSAAMGKAVFWGYINTNPCQNADTPAAGGSETMYLDEAEARLLLEELNEKAPIWWRVMITCDLLSGLRRGELLGLQWPDVDFDNHMIHIRRTWNYGGAKMGCYFSTPKSARSKRPLHLSASFFTLLAQLQAWQEQQRELLGDAWRGRDDDQRVFTTEDGAPVFPTSPSQYLSKFCERNGLTHVTLHPLRHTYASLMIADEIPLVEISSHLGHARTSTTEDVYGHVIASAHAKGLATLDRFGDVIQAGSSGNKPQISPKKRKTG